MYEIMPSGRQKIQTNARKKVAKKNKITLRLLLLTQLFFTPRALRS